MEIKNVYYYTLVDHIGRLLKIGRQTSTELNVDKPFQTKVDIINATTAKFLLNKATEHTDEEIYLMLSKDFEVELLQVKQDED